MTDSTPTPAEPIKVEDVKDFAGFCQFVRENFKGAPPACRGDDCDELVSLKESYGQLLAENVRLRATPAEIAQPAAPEPALPQQNPDAARLIRLRKNVGNAEYERQCEAWLAAYDAAQTANLHPVFSEDC